jgi:hypothetical protein
MHIFYTLCDYIMIKLVCLWGGTHTRKALLVKWMREAAHTPCSKETSDDGRGGMHICMLKSEH